MPASTSSVSMFMRSQIMATSFIKAMLISRWLFSITLTASAVLMVDTGKVPAAMTISYTFLISRADSSSMPETILRMLVSVWTRSPGLMRSGE